VPITYEDMMQVDRWDDSKFIFKKETSGYPDIFGDGF
jgi:hypothetical protein